MHFRELHDRLLRVLDFIETQRDLLTGLLEADLAVISNRPQRGDEEGHVVGRDPRVGARSSPAIYGMNFRNMPELNWSFGYPFALGSMVVVMGALYWMFKTQGLALTRATPIRCAAARRRAGWRRRG